MMDVGFSLSLLEVAKLRFEKRDDSFYNKVYDFIVRYRDSGYFSRTEEYRAAIIQIITHYENEEAYERCQVIRDLLN